MSRKLSQIVCALGLSLSVNGFASTTPEICGEIQTSRGERIELGLIYQSLIPSGLPDFSRTLPAYGGVFGIPLFGGTLQLQALATADALAGQSLYLAESNFRLEMETPFVHLFALFGAHFLHYRLTSGAAHAGFGANFGIGTALALGKGFELSLAIRTYIQQRTMVTFGGGFSFLL